MVVYMACWGRALPSGVATRAAVVSCRGGHVRVLWSSAGTAAPTHSRSVLHTSQHTLATTGRAAASGFCRTGGERAASTSIFRPQHLQRRPLHLPSSRAAWILRPPTRRRARLESGPQRRCRRADVACARSAACTFVHRAPSNKPPWSSQAIEHRPRQKAKPPMLAQHEKALEKSIKDLQRVEQGQLLSREQIDKAYDVLEARRMGPYVGEWRRGRVQGPRASARHSAEPSERTLTAILTARFLAPPPSTHPTRSQVRCVRFPASRPVQAHPQACLSLVAPAPGVCMHVCRAGLAPPSHAVYATSRAVCAKAASPQWVPSRTPT
jgi:hypothetical protein